MTKILLLDVMGTLVTEPYMEVLPKFFGMSLKELFARRDMETWPAFERNEMSEEEYFEAFDKAQTKARIALISKYKELIKGDYMKYTRGIQTLGICTTPGKYLKVSVGRRFD